jgi:hypothetical protein
LNKSTQAKRESFKSRTLSFFLMKMAPHILN